MEFLNKVDIVLGCSYGDEGKGKVVNYLVHENKYDLCVRFNGSCNAGHTVYFNEQKFVLHQMPVGILRNETSILISSDCLVDVDKLKKEIKELTECGIQVSDRLFLSSACHIITPELVEEDKQTNIIGTTCSGIGPTYAQKMIRKGKRVDTCKEVFEKMGFTIVDLRTWWQTDLVKTKFKKILLEGAQGFGLDINWTDQYPYCTSSTCSLAGAINTGIQIKYISNIFGITKAYDTYVGTSKFQPDNDDDLIQIGNVGNEYGSTTGRRRQCNYLNLDKLIEALYINNCNVCIINKMDILEQLNIFRLYYKGELKTFTTSIEMETYIKTAYPNIHYVISRSPTTV
jgi:adenylosuccinate synthase